MRISIVGAGPGGLTCARILQRHGIAATVYDRDAGPHSRDQGGTLDLREDDGQLALREAGLLEEFHALSRPEGQEMRQFTPAGVLADRFVPAESDRFKPEIDRGQLRDLLLDSLRPGTVQWGRQLVAAEKPGRLRFADGTEVESDLVIGADGAFSRVRPAISPALPHYTGISFQEARFDGVERRHPDLAELVGPGSATAADGDRGVFAQRNSGDQIRVYIMQRVAQNWPGSDDTDTLRARLETAFAHWSPKMRQLITDNDGPYVNRPLFVLPVPHVWAPDPTITLLGDAAHLMPPVGLGANLAMLDACDLALALLNSATIADAVRSYEKTMLPRGAELAAETADAPEHLLSAH
jgi:2-polyprenyl-6-methoxyphenol hydroxylase-like FAD-dependent oxidoreductase